MSLECRFDGGIELTWHDDAVGAVTTSSYYLVEVDLTVPHLDGHSVTETQIVCVERHATELARPVVQQIDPQIFNAVVMPGSRFERDLNFGL